MVRDALLPRPRPRTPGRAATIPPAASWTGLPTRPGGRGGVRRSARPGPSSKWNPSDDPPRPAPSRLRRFERIRPRLSLRPRDFDAHVTLRTYRATAERPGEGVDGRIVIQAWIASRALIALVALMLAVLEGRRISDMVSNWDVRHFGELAAGGYLGRARRHPDGLLPRPAGAAVDGAAARHPGRGHRGGHLAGRLGAAAAAACCGSVGPGRRSPGCSRRPRCSPPCPTPSRCSAPPPSGPGNGPGPTAGCPRRS